MSSMAADTTVVPELAVTAVAAFVASGVFLVLGIRTMRKPGSSGKCVLSFLLVLLGSMTACVSVAIAYLMKREPYWAGVAVGSVAGLAGVVLAIVGLSTFRPPMMRGRLHAWASIGICLLALFVTIFGSLYMTMDKFPRSRYAVAASSPSTKKFEDRNFQYTPPDSSFAVFNAGMNNPDVTLAYMRARPQPLFVMIIAEHGQAMADLDNESLVSITQAQIQSIDPNAVCSPQEPVTLNGMDGAQYVTDVTIDSHRFTYVRWQYAKNGFAYQVVVYGPASDRQRVLREAPTVMAGFRQIDPNRVEAQGSAAAGRVSAPDFGIIVDLPSQWRNWPKMSEEAPNAVVGARRTDNVHFSIFPFVYGPHKPTVGAVDRALMNAAAGVDYPQRTPPDLHAIEEGKFQGFSCSTRRNVENMDLDYRLKLLRGSQCAYLVMAWGAAGKDVDGAMREVCGGMKLNDQAVRIPLESMPANQKSFHALLFNEVALYEWKARNYERAMPLFAQAARLSPEDQVIATNTLSCHNEMGRHQEALSFFNSLSARLREDPTIRAWQAAMLRKTGQLEQAARVYEAIFSGAYREDDVFTQYIQTLESLERHPQILKAFEKYLKEGQSLDVQIALAQFHRRRGNFEQAVNLLEKLRASGADSPQLAVELVDAYIEWEQPKKALAVCEELISRDMGSANLYYLKARSECELKWYRQAKVSLEKALQAAPKSEEVQELLRHVSGMLGEGDNSAVKNPIDPVPLPKEMAAKVAAVAPKGGAGYGAEYDFYMIGISYRKDQQFKITRRFLVRIEDSGGVSKFSTLQQEFDPLSEELFVNDLVVRDAKGKEVSRGRQDDYYVIDSQDGYSVSHDKVLCMPVPNLQPGYSISVTITVRQRGKPSLFPWTRHYVTFARPAALWGLYCLADAKSLRHIERNGLKFSAIEGGLAWTIQNVAPFEYESRLAPVCEFVPHVMISDASLEWKAVGEKYLQEIHDKLAASDSIAALARKTCASAKTEAQKINCLVDYLQKSYTYKAVEFGRRAQIPNAPEKVIANKYGDCKDHAVLLRSLLEAVGVKSELALVNTQHTLERSLPSLDQFDHMVLYLPGKTGGRFIDATDKNFSGPAAPPGLGGRQALVLSPGGSRLVDVPDYDPKLCRVSIRSRMSLVNHSNLQVEQTLQCDGYIASYLRQILKDSEAASQDRDLALLLGIPLVQTVKIDNLYDNARPLSIRLTYLLKEQCKPAGSGHTMKLPAYWERFLLEVPPVATRKNPFRVLYPYEVESTVELPAPPGAAWGTLGPDKSAGSSKPLDWETQVRQEGGIIKTTFRCRERSGIYPKETYASFQEAADKGLRSISRELSYTVKK